MNTLKNNLILILIAINMCPTFVIAASERIDGLEYEVRKINEAPIDKPIAKRFDMYEVSFENKTDKTFSIPGYSIDLGVDYSTIDQIRALLSNKSSGKLAVFNIAAGAASIALGGIARTASSTIRSIGGFKRKVSSLEDDRNILSHKKTYVLYPGDGISLFIFVDKSLSQIPNTMRFICHDEELNSNYVLINNKIDLKEYSFSELSNGLLNKPVEKYIASPTTDEYK